jgi:hypothetical protein
MVGSPFVTGACPASGGAASTPALTWGRVSRACAPALTAKRGACGDGQICAPAAAAPYSSRMCILHEGVTDACPDPAYPSGPLVRYRGVADTRGCSACSCTPPAGGACSIASPAIQRFYSVPCVGQSGTLPAPSVCTATFGGAPLMLIAAPKLEDAGACAPDGGKPSGAAVGTEPATLCCER